MFSGSFDISLLYPFSASLVVLLFSWNVFVRVIDRFISILVFDMSASVDGEGYKSYYMAGVIANSDTMLF